MKNELISIEGLDKPALLAGLYNADKGCGYEHLHSFPNGVSRDEAAATLERRVCLAKTHQLTAFDLKGHSIDLDLSGDELDPTNYDFFNGEGAAAAVVAKLRERA